MRGRIKGLAVVGAVVTAASAAPAIGVGVPPSLVGTWGKTLTAATWHRNGIDYESPGHWGIQVSAGSVTGILAPPGTSDTPPLTTMHTTVGGASVTFGPTADGFCPHRATYTWKTAGRMLVFKLVRDDCNARRVLLTAGTWTRT